MTLEIPEHTTLSSDILHESLSDEELVRAIQEEESPEKKELYFASLYVRYQARMINYLYGFVFDADIAQDLCQEAMIKLYHNLDKFLVNEKFSSWFYRIVTNTALTYLRKMKNRESIVSETALDALDMDVDDTREQTPEDNMLQSELWKKMSQAISLLPEKFRVVFVMRYQNRESFRTISQSLELSERTVKWRMQKALQLLKEKMQKMGYDSDLSLKN